MKKSSTAALLKAEFYKMLHSPEYRLILTVCMVRRFFLTWHYAGRAIWLQGNGLTGYKAWDWFRNIPLHTGGYLYYICILAAVMIGGELRTRKMSEAAKCGQRRSRIFLGKMIAFFAASLFLFIVYAFTEAFAWSLRHGWGSYSVGTVWLIIAQTMLEFLYVFCLLGLFPAFLAFLAKNEIVTVAGFLGIIYLAFPMQAVKLFLFRYAIFFGLLFLLLSFVRFLKCDL